MIHQIKERGVTPRASETLVRLCAIAGFQVFGNRSNCLVAISTRGPGLPIVLMSSADELP